MSEQLKPPYLRKADERNAIQVWLVDGAYIRTRMDEEFTNFGQHYRFKYIPQNEFWIDSEADPDAIVRTNCTIAWPKRAGRELQGERPKRGHSPQLPFLPPS
ncbi:MAG: hypothetical protein Q7T04_08150 [Dehalococcoidia bacterium]|nr:hypothetical protein [Dehalococcoidia bacterium]